MLTHPTLDKLQTLKFTGMAVALAEQMQMPDIEELAFEERLGLLVDRELTERENRRLTSRSLLQSDHPDHVEAFAGRIESLVITILAKNCL